MHIPRGKLPVVAAVAILALANAAPVAAAKSTTTISNQWSNGISVSGAQQPDPTRGAQLNDVAVNASGLAIAAWDQYTYTGTGGATIGAAIETNGRWAQPFTVSGSFGFSMMPRVAVGADGTLAVSWTYQDPAAQAAAQQKIQVAVRRAGSTAWTTTTLATYPLSGVQGLGLFVPMAIDANGTVTAAWTIWDGTIHRVQSATLPKGGSWSTPVSVAAGFDGLYPSLAQNARGDTALVFSSSPYTATGSTVVDFVSRPAGSSTWSAPVAISETMSSSVGYISSPIVALDATGRATVIYVGWGVEAVRQGASGWSAPKTVIASPNSISSLQGLDLGVDDAGNALVEAAYFDATVGVDRSCVYVARGTAAGTWSAAQRITDPTAPVDAYAPRAAVSPDGKLLLAAWVDHYHQVVQVARFDPATGTWKTVNVGKPTAFSSFQEIVSIDAASSTVARIAWKNATGGTQTMVSDFRP